MMMNNFISRNINAIYHSFRVELVNFFNDSALHVTFVILSIAVAFLYSSVYNREVVQKSPITIVDMDNTVLSRNMIQLFNATQQVRVNTICNDMNEGKNEFYRGDVFGIVYIPKDFGKDVTLGKQTAIAVYSDASSMLHNKAIAGASALVTGTFNAQIQMNGNMHKGLTYINSIETRNPINAITKNLYNPAGGYASSLLPMVYLIIIQTLLLTAIGVLGGTMREKNNYFASYNIDPNASSTPLLSSVLIGRSMAYLLLCMIVFSIICGGCFALFRLPFRASYWDVLVFLIPFFLGVIFLGFSLMGIFKKREDAALSVTFSGIPAVFLTGVSWPALTFPTWVNVLSNVFPSTLGARGFIALTQFEASFDDVKELWNMLWLTALFYFFLALLVNYRFKLSVPEK